jgi:hypothetical protein
MNYWQNLSLKFLIALFMIILSGCSTTIELSSTLPYQTQFLVKSIKFENGIGFRYISNSKGDNIDIPNALYSINKPFESLLYELVQTKFGNVNTNSKDSLIVTLENVEPNSSRILTGISVSLSLTVGIQIIKDHKVSSNSFKYNMTNSYNNMALIKSDLDNFLMKYVIVIDKYIDTQFSIQ